MQQQQQPMPQQQQQQLQQQQPNPQPLPPTLPPTFLTAPLAQPPTPHFFANHPQPGQFRPALAGRGAPPPNFSQRQQAQPYGRGRGSQGFGNQQQGFGNQQQGFGGQQQGSGPATFPNNTQTQGGQQSATVDLQGDTIYPCPRCGKPHRGRCWKCSKCNLSTTCPCPLPRVCMKCGMVTHTTEQCARQIGTYRGASGSMRVSAVAGTPVGDCRPDLAVFNSLSLRALSNECRG
eukprot:GHVU01058234.1.p1 GENE.GHVU01058234.1~~GHVU01058234.1.p1  ORF type:complete len:233 (+),score=21.57 GHVU01058234.1:3-701(+)